MAAQGHFTQMRMRFDRFRSLLSKDEARRIVSNIAKLPRATKPPSDRLIGIIGFSGALQIADRGFTTVVGLSDTADARVGPEPQVPQRPVQRLMARITTIRVVGRVGALPIHRATEK